MTHFLDYGNGTEHKKGVLFYLQFIPEKFQIPRRIQGDFVIYYDMLWYITMYNEILRYIMKYYDILWYIIIYYEILWYIMKNYDILWHIKIY